jgi:hypothetical protein
MEPVQYQFIVKRFGDAEEQLAAAVTEWLREQVELRAPGVKWRADYDYSRDQQCFNFLRGADQRCILPSDKDQERGEFRSVPNIFTEMGYDYVYMALEHTTFRAGIAELMQSFGQLLLPLGALWLSFSPAAPNAVLVLDEQRQLADATQYVAVLRPASRHAPDDTDVVPCLPTQCDLALWWQTGDQCDEGNARHTLSLAYGRTQLQFDVDECIAAKLARRTHYFALRHSAILSRLVK